MTLFERIAAGEAAAVKECMDTYGGLVWSLARRYSESAADAEDATQEIFLELWKSAGRYDPAMGKESTFITTIARRRLIDRLRASSRRPDTQEYDDGLTVDPATAERSAGDIAADVETAQHALASLNEAQREILVLGIVEGLTHSEIATATGKPLGTVKTQMRRGLIRLRSLLDDESDSVEGSA
ncbi:MAG: sigma-70 family RNA polymerase sigma factor [Gammaproteobacteria bacterium]|jgi:RNA polymerase sigma-70 factor (ECF subfamily)